MKLVARSLRFLPAGGVVVLVAFAASALSTVLGVSCALRKTEDTTALVQGAGDGDPEVDRASMRAEFDGRDKRGLAESTITNNPFCPSCAALPGAAAPTPGTMSRLPLELLGTMEAADPRFSLATIRDTEQETLGAYGVHDTVRRGVTVEAVGRGRVVVRNGSALEIIELGAAVRDTAMPTPRGEDAPPRTGGIEGADDAIECDGPHCTVDRRFVDKLLANPGLLTKQARVVPAIQGGETRGYKLFGVRPGSLPKLLGLKNGDLLTNVNGNELNSLDAAMELYGKLRNASHLSVTILRKGKSLQREVEIR